tara:strand:- start:837 stop:1202 length:366 start_codon:yes stop_codon:yes gene_type:complete
LKLARVERGKYQCAHCECIFKKIELQADHIEPVLDLEHGFVDWNTYIERLFCPVENFQALCRVCHSAKTIQEDAMRQHFRNIRKEKARVEKEELKVKAKAWAKENKSTMKAYYALLEGEIE